VTDLEVLSNPFSWELFPVMPVAKRGMKVMYMDKEDIGLVFANTNMKAEPVVYLINIIDAEGRKLSEIINDGSVRRIVYEDLNALSVAWRID
jgi:hypothetical protein